MRVDKLTKRWIRNASDEMAARNGCRFDEARGTFVVEWLERYLKLYEGEQAGEPFECRDWQFDCTMRMFGWARMSKRWRREVRRFRRAGIWKPKKNKKSPTLAAWGLYLFAGDGELGQKVFCLAKDATQVKENVCRHAVEMVLSSPELAEECDIDQRQMRLFHRPSRSLLMPLTSADSERQKAKEGLNGSVLGDETHILTRAFMNRVERAGISRSEPLHIEVSTAGNDPMSYGREQYDYGKRVESGEHEDEQYFFDCHEAPQDLKDAELARSPIKYGKLANPSWGHTVGEEEFLGDYQRSRASLSTLADFKMYRLNIWQSASNPAIRQEDWDACGDDFDVDELVGQPCYAALDLGFKWDTSCLALWFPWADDDDPAEPTYRLLTKFWLPEYAANREAKKIKWHAWQRRGDLAITSGNTADFPLIKREIVACAGRYQIEQLNYDERFAQVLAQELQDEHGIAVRSFSQSAPSFNAPCRSFEKLILDGRVRHLGNQVMDWQVGNLTWKDRGGLWVPAKPEHNPLARIDGPVAAIMGLDAAEQPANDEWYEPGMLKD